MQNIVVHKVRMCDVVGYKIYPPTTC